VAKSQEQRGVLVDPLEWANKNFDKLKTVRVGNTKVTPKMMVRDKKHDIIKQIQENEKKNLFIELPYRDYVLFHRICYKSGLKPTEFIQKLVAMFEVEHEDVKKWLDGIMSESDEMAETMPLTEDELYDMLERARKR